MTTNLDNVSDVLKYLRDQWDRQLKEEYARGHLAGQKYSYEAGHARGYRDGYKEAVAKVASLIADADAAERGDESGPTVAPEPEPIIVEAPASAVTVSPGLQRALDYVRDHPGTTSKEVYRHVKNNAALYKLAKRGLIEKRGSQFYPKDAS